MAVSLERTPCTSHIVRLDFGMVRLWRWIHPTMPMESTGPRHLLPPPASNEALASYLWLSPSRFRVCWWLVELVHVICAIFSLVASAVHTLLAIPSVYDNNSLIAIPRDTLILSAWSYFAVGLVHFGAFAIDVYRSLRSGYLTFGPDSSAQVCPPRDTRSSSVISRCRLCAWATMPLAIPFGLWRRYFAIDGLFGAQGSLFEEGFHIRQLVELMLQTYQAYHISQSVPRLWILNCVVVMIIVNGVTTPLTHALFHKKSRILRHTIVLVLDLLVDLVISVAVPLAIAIPRLIPFEQAAGGYPRELIYDDVWITMAVSEARQVLVTSKLDFISSLFPFLVVLFGLDTIKILTRRKVGTSWKLGRWLTTTQDLETNPPSRIGPHRGPVVQDSSRAVVVPSGIVDAIVQSEPVVLMPEPASIHLGTSRPQSKSSVSGFLQRVWYLSMAWALCAVAIHICTLARQLGGGRKGDVCALRMNSWMARLTPCAVARLSCHQLQTVGDDAILQDTLATLDRKSLSRLVLSHCPRLYVPTITTEFSQLRGFLIFNSTVSSWSHTTAVTSSTTPLLSTMHFIDTNFSMDGFPDGIYHAFLPKNMNLLVYQSNITKLPESIGYVWGSHKWTSFWIENAPIEALPTSFADLNIVKVAVVGTQIKYLDDQIFAKQSLTWVRLSRNPLVRLPTSLCGPSTASTLTHLLLQNTSITELTQEVHAWLVTENQRNRVGTTVVSFQGSPVCNDPSYQHLCDPLNSLIRDDYRYDIVASQRPL